MDVVSIEVKQDVQDVSHLYDEFVDIREESGHKNDEDG